MMIFEMMVLNQDQIVADGQFIVTGANELIKARLKTDEFTEEITLA
jgi:hypothetical protein